jgi:hypothetical protein
MMNYEPFKLNLEYEQGAPNEEVSVSTLCSSFQWD